MDPFLGEIRIFPWYWAPRGWALCNGALLPISQNAALNALLGQTYGGDGKTQFALPDLRGRTPIHAGRGPDTLDYKQGAVGGLEAVSLDSGTLPAHTHAVHALAGSKGNAPQPASNIPSTVGWTGSATTGVNIYAPATSPLTPLNAGSFSVEGSGVGHNNMQPFIVLNFCIATSGIFPPRQ